MPESGAGPVRDGVTIVRAPPSSVVGVSVTPAMAGGFTRTVACCVVLPRVAVIVAVEAFAATVTDAGTVAAALFDDRLTTNAVGAGPVRVTVPVAALPLVTADGTRETDASFGASTVMVPVATDWLKDPVIVA